MASRHTNSAREELARIKHEFASQSKAGKVSLEAAMLIKSLIILIELFFSIFLEKNTKKNNRNSSKPSSQTEPDNTTKGRSGSKSKGKLEQQLSAANARTVTTDILLSVDTCQGCGDSLQDQAADGLERRTRIDIFFEKTVEHFDAEIKTCQQCQTTNKAQFPSDLHGKLQYGNGIKAFVVQLMVSQMVAINRVQKMLSTMIGQRLSEATLLSYILRLHSALESWEQSAKEKLLTQPCLYVDETSLKVERKNHWIHVHSAGDITLKLLHNKRGLEAMTDNNIIPCYSGVLVHDCWASYLSYDHCLHGLCGSHLLRELTFIIDSNHYPKILS